MAPLQVVDYVVLHELVPHPGQESFQDLLGQVGGTYAGLQATPDMVEKEWEILDVSLSRIFPIMYFPQVLHFFNHAEKEPTHDGFPL